LSAGEVAAGGDELVFGVNAQAPVFLQVAEVGGGNGDGGLQLKKADAHEALDDDRQDQPRGEDDAEREKGTGLIKTLKARGRK
jgi:hypothetical protein